ncbi:MAG: amidohydrolase [Lachnospiraceae bacterium]|nr:amidohydrolase [Lachnospiraceae bacterium]
MNYYQRALEIKEEIIKHRRYIHENAETGLNLPKTTAYILDILTEYGIEAKRLGHGILATIGQGEKSLLLRADMDALPMKEDSGEPFACPTGTEGHCCGHDMHAAILLGTAKMLKEQEDALKGTVYLMFQPAEETFEGARDMIAAGLLEETKPDASLALHVMPGHQTPGTFMYNNTGIMMSSVDGFRIHIQGKGGHGAFPQNAINPITIGAHIHIALSELIANEADPAHSCVLSIGHFEAGKAPNIIPHTAFMEGTLRTKNEEARKKLVRRIHEVCEFTAKRYGGSVSIETLSDMSILKNDPDFTTQMVDYMKELPIPNLNGIPGSSANASDDYAMITNVIPSCYFNLAAGFEDERGDYGVHHPKVRFNEDALPIGASLLAHCTARWLKDTN